MGIMQNIDTANIGLISRNMGELVRLNQRQVEQNDEIIALLQENLVYLAQQKAYEVTTH